MGVAVRVAVGVAVGGRGVAVGVGVGVTLGSGVAVGVGVGVTPGPQPASQTTINKGITKRRIGDAPYKRLTDSVYGTYQTPVRAAGFHPIFRLSRTLSA